MWGGSRRYRERRNRLGSSCSSTWNNCRRYRSRSRFKYKRLSITKMNETRIRVANWMGHNLTETPTPTIWIIVSQLRLLEFNRRCIISWHLIVTPTMLIILHMIIIQITAKILTTTVQITIITTQIVVVYTENSQ